MTLVQDFTTLSLAELYAKYFAPGKNPGEGWLSVSDSDIVALRERISGLASWRKRRLQKAPEGVRIERRTNIVGLTPEMRGVLDLALAPTQDARIGTENPNWDWVKSTPKCCEYIQRLAEKNRAPIEADTDALFSIHNAHEALRAPGVVAPDHDFARLSLEEINAKYFSGVLNTRVANWADIDEAAACYLAARLKAAPPCEEVALLYDFMVPLTRSERFSTTALDPQEQGLLFKGEWEFLPPVGGGKWWSDSEPGRHMLSVLAKGRQLRMFDHFNAVALEWQVQADGWPPEGDPRRGGAPLSSAAEN